MDLDESTRSPTGHGPAPRQVWRCTVCQHRVPGLLYRIAGRPLGACFNCRDTTVIELVELPS